MEYATEPTTSTAGPDTNHVRASINGSVFSGPVIDRGNDGHGVTYLIRDAQDRERVVRTANPRHEILARGVDA